MQNDAGLIRIKIKLLRGTFYAGKNKSQKIYLTGTLADPIIKNNQLVLKEGRRVQVLYAHDNLSVALRALSDFDPYLTFLVNWSSEILSNTIIDNQGNEVVKLDSDLLCEKSEQSS